MFYSQYVLTKKGPLAKIWLAAHMQSKLTKGMVFAVDVCKAVDNILTPAAPMALRLSSNLLLGVSRINSRKAKYLLQDSLEAMTKLKITYVTGAVINLDLPADENHANFNSITLDNNAATAGNITMNISSSRTPLLDLDLMPRGNGSTKRSIDRSTTNTNSFLAAERDITIDEFAGGLATGSMNDAFALDPELFRERDETLGGDEPLMFTPRRTPSKSASPAMASVLSIPRSTGSVEVLRAGTPTAGGPAGTPRLSMGTSGQLGTTPGQESPEINRSAAIDPNVVGTPKLGERSGNEIEIARDAEENIPLPPDVDMTLDESLQAPTAPTGEEDGDGADLARISMGEGEGRLSLGDQDELMLDEGGGTGDSSRGTPIPEARIDAPTPRPTQPEGEDEVDENSTQTASQPTTQRGRKRRHISRIDAEKTEITASEFRDCLNDTSDLIRRPRAKRKTGKADPAAEEEAETADEILARPAIDMPDEINALFQQMFGTDELLQRVASPLSERDGEQARKASPSPEPEDVETTRRSPSISVGPPSASPTVSVGAQAEFLPPQMEMVEPEIPLPEDTPVLLPLLEDSPLPIPEEPVELPVQPVPLPDELELRVQDEETEAPTGTLKEVAFTRVEVDGEESERLTKRALKMREYIASRFTEETNDENKFNLNASLRNEARTTRRVAARSFYEVLNLCSHRLVKVEQDTPYGDVRVTALQPAFDQAASVAL